jgi:hypothetical protein
LESELIPLTKLLRGENSRISVLADLSGSLVPHLTGSLPVRVRCRLPQMLEIGTDPPLWRSHL